MCRRVDRKTPEFRPYIVATHVDWSESRKCHGTRPHTKNRNADDSGIRCATSYGLRGPKSSGKRGQSPYLVSQGFSRGGSDEKKMKRGAILLWIQQGGVYGHSDGRSPEDVREQASKGRSVDLTSAQNASGESSGR